MIYDNGDGYIVFLSFLLWGAMDGIVGWVWDGLGQGWGVGWAWFGLVLA